MKDEAAPILSESVSTDRCFYFGVWNQPGHFIVAPGGSFPGEPLATRLCYFNGHVHLDGNLAPRRHVRTHALCFGAQGKTHEARQAFMYDGEELPQGQFLLHHLDNGYTAIQWWDRTQGDRRGACNSTVLLEGRHTSEEMLTAAKRHFPHVVANLEKAGVRLVEVKIQEDEQDQKP